MLKSVMMEAFVSNIIKGMPQYQAYQKAGYKQNKPETALMSNASALVRNRKVAARLAYKRKQLAKKFDVDAERITRERVIIGFANIQDFLNKDGKLRPLNEVDRDSLAAVSSVKFDGKKVEFTLCNKQVALDALSKQLGLYERDNDQKRESIFDTLARVGLRRKQIGSRVIDDNND